MVSSVALSLACCVPDFIYQLLRGNVHTWFPFIDVFTTKELLNENILVRVVDLLLTAISWGFLKDSIM